MILTKQEIIKSNYILVQNAESLREQLRTFVILKNYLLKEFSMIFFSVRTQAAEVRMICSSSTTSLDNLDESLPCLIYNNNDDTPDGEKQTCQSSLFSEINSLVYSTVDLFSLKMEFFLFFSLLGNNVK